MNLEEMLEYTAEEFLDDRTTLVEGDNDALWSDSFLVRQFNQAQRILARRSWCLIDEDHPIAGRVVLLTGIATYALHKSVLRIFWLKPTDQENPLTRHTETALMGAVPIADQLYDLNSTTAETGRPLGFASDSGTRRIRIFRTPSATEDGLILVAKVARLPVVWLTLEDVTASPEVPEDWHLDICEFAAGKALTLPNVDSDQKVEGRRLLDAFDLTVREARRDRQRAELEPAHWQFSTATSLL